MNNDISDIISFAERYTDKVVEADSDLYLLMRNRFNRFIKDYAKEFNVEIRNYKQYFHTYAVESDSTFDLFRIKDYKRIIITPVILGEFAWNGVWDLIYPPDRMS